MTRYVALLRAVNLGAHNKVPMADLRALCERLGMKEVRSLLVSGNLVFGSAARSAPALEKMLEEATCEALGVRTDFFVRSAREWDRLVAANPFKAEAKSDPGRLILMCFKDAPKGPGVSALEQAIVGRERVRPGERHAYFVYPDGVGRSRLTNLLIEKKLGTRGTARNWNTVLKLKDLLT